MVSNILYDLTKQQSKRLDILKSLFALFIVYIHTNPTSFVTYDLPVWFECFEYIISELIPRCAVSGFFLLSSLLLYRKEFKWKNNIKKKIRTLLIPYFLMNTLWIVIFAIVQNIPQTQSFFTNEGNIISNFTIFRWLQAYGIGSEYPFLYPLWFLRNLFLLNVLAWMIKRIIDRFPIISLIIILLLYFFLPSINCYYFRITDIAMWCLGYFLIKYKVNLNKFDNSRLVPCIYVLTLILSLIFKDTNIAMINLFLSRFRLSISLIFWYSFFSNNYRGIIQRTLLRYAQYSFGIYLFHENFLTFFVKLISKIVEMDLSVLLLEYLLLPCFVVVLVIVFCRCFKKLIPSIFTLLTGERC